MEKLEFDSRLKELSVMTESEEATELFAASYEDLLRDVKEEKDSVLRIEQAQRMQKLLFLEMAFVMNRWLRHHRTSQGPFMATGGRA